MINKAVNKAVLVRVNIKQTQQATYTSELSRSAAPQGLVRLRRSYDPQWVNLTD